MTPVIRSARAAVIALFMTAALLTAPSGAASDTPPRPRKNATYKGSATLTSTGVAVTGSVKIKTAGGPSAYLLKLKKLKIKISCPAGTKRIGLKNVELSLYPDTYFDVKKSNLHIIGTWLSRDSVYVELDTDGDTVCGDPYFTFNAEN